MGEGWNKFLFLHIPKTAGSSFNAIFRSVVPPGRHFEHLEGKPQRLKDICEDGLPYFVSGHLTFESIREYVERPDVFSMSLSRQPVAQLLSHLKWVKYAGSPHFPHPQSIHASILQLARELYKSPLDDIDAIGPLIDSRLGRQLFDNLHLSYATHALMERVDEGHLQSALENVGKLSFVFALEDRETALGELRRRIPEIARMGSENAARSSESIDLSDARIAGFYRALTHYDEKLYDAVRCNARHMPAAACPD